MEKQRSTTVIRSDRRLLICLILLFSAGFLFSQSRTLTASQIQKLRLSPEEGQNLYTKTDIKFSVSIPYVRPAEIQVLNADQSNDVYFRSMRKNEDYDTNGTLLELWYNFDRTGIYRLSPLSIMIQGRKRSISFEEITLTEDPSKMLPRIVIIFDNEATVYSYGSDFPNPLFTAQLGTKIHFTVNLQYAMQLVKFSWDIPQDSIFTQTREYEFTEVKYRERIYSHDLIPVADFEWTALSEGVQALPKFRIEAAGYDGYRNSLLMPEVMIDFKPKSQKFSDAAENDIFSDAFFQEKESVEAVTFSNISKEDCIRLADYYSKEHIAFFTYFKAHRNRINFEESCGLPADSTGAGSSLLLYISIIIIVASIVYLIILRRKNRKIRMLIMVILIIAATCTLSYALVKRTEKSGICLGCKIYSIPQESAISTAEISAGNRVRILEKTDNWYYVELGQTGGWCSIDDICLIR